MIDEKKLWEQRPEYLNEQQKMELQNKKGGYNKGWNNCLDIFLDIIQAQPKVNEWIPVTEKLPEDGDYLCSFDDGFITRVSFINGDWELWADSGEVIAWQSLPNPYVKE